MLGAGGNTQYNLGFRVYLKDNFSGPAANIKKTLDGMGDAHAMHRANLTAARNITLAVAGASLLIAKGMYDAAMEGAEFLHTMQGVLAISEATTQEFTRLKTLAVSLGRETIFTPDQVASGMRFMAMAGQTAAQIQSTAQDATYLAASTMTQLGGKLGAADILTNALKGFGLGVESSTIMSDMLTYATTSANVSLVDLGNSIRYVASTSQNLNIPLQESLGFIMALGNAGIQSSMAGTALENMYRYLAMSMSEFATKRQQASWKAIGISKGDIMDASGQFKPMIEVLGLIKTQVDDLGAVDRQNILKEIFGVRGQRAAGTLIRNLDQASTFVDKLHSGQIKGTAATKSALMMDTLKGASLRLTSALDGLKAAWADSFGGKMIGVFLNGLAKLVGWLADLVKIPIVSGIVAFGAAAVTLTGIVFGLKAMVLGLALALDRMRVSLAGIQSASIYAMGNLTGRTTTTMAKGATASSVMMMGKPATQYRGAGGQFISKKAAMVTGVRASKSTAMFFKWLPRIGRGLGAAVGFLSGPIGIAIMLGVTLLPMLINGISSLIGATEDNTAALATPSAYDVKMDELLILLGDQSINQMVATINKNLGAMISQGRISLAEATKLSQSQAGMFQLMQMAYESGLVGMMPITYPVTESSSKPYGK